MSNFVYTFLKEVFLYLFTAENKKSLLTNLFYIHFNLPQKALNSIYITFHLQALTFDHFLVLLLF